mmetsp:Transcript_1992/g.4532  ORF Transcript_1992/g.4532 Transcript_1992/m.4532 type:complete len:87 (-) Transcript_1992:163-423(-)
MYPVHPSEHTHASCHCHINEVLVSSRVQQCTQCLLFSFASLLPSMFVPCHIKNIKDLQRNSQQFFFFVDGDMAEPTVFRRSMFPVV